MTQGTADRVTFNAAAQTTLRVLIASYFLAVALRLINGTEFSLLFNGVLPSPFDGAVAAGLVFLCSFMIMLGWATRVAALMLALMTLFASYLTMVDLGGPTDIGAFWRDIALIAGLLLIYGERKMGSNRSRRVLQRQIVPRRVNTILDRAALHGDPVLQRPARPDMSKIAARLATLPEPGEAIPLPRSQLVFTSTRRARQVESEPAEVENIFTDDAMVA